MEINTLPTVREQRLQRLARLAILTIIALLTVSAVLLRAARADEPSPTTAMDVTCTDGHIAHHVLGDMAAPCRKHGGVVSAIAVDDAAAHGMLIVPISADDTDDSDTMHKVATCNDGAEFWANSKSHKGACKGHDGIKSWDDGTKVKVKRAEHRVPKGSKALAVKGAK